MYVLRSVFGVLDLWGSPISSRFIPTSLVGRLKLDPFDMHNLPIVSLIFSRLTTTSVVSEVLLCPVVYRWLDLDICFSPSGPL